MFARKTLVTALMLAASLSARADFLVNYRVALTADVDFRNGIVHEVGYGITNPYAFTAGAGDTVEFVNPFPKATIPATATFLGLVADPNDPTTPHVAYFLNETYAALAVGNSFENVFAGGFTETQIATALVNLNSENEATQNSALDVLFPFLDANEDRNVVVGSGGLTGGLGTLVQFSNGRAIGTGTVSAVNAVPEPATMAALGAGALGLLRRRKR